MIQQQPNVGPKNVGWKKNLWCQNRFQELCATWELCWKSCGAIKCVGWKKNLRCNISSVYFITKSSLIGLKACNLMQGKNKGVQKTYGGKTVMWLQKHVGPNQMPRFAGTISSWNNWTLEHSSPAFTFIGAKEKKGQCGAISVVCRNGKHMFAVQVRF